MGRKKEGLKGVRQRQWGSWVSEIRHPITKKRVWLGTFATADDAARAYNEAALFLSGSQAITNSYPSFSSSKTMLSQTLRSKLWRCCFHTDPEKSTQADGNSSWVDPSSSSSSRLPFSPAITSSRYFIFASWINEDVTRGSSKPMSSPPSCSGNSSQDSSGGNDVAKGSITEKHKKEEEIIVAQMMNELLNWTTSYSLDLDYP